jgi:hypothetical protein
MATGEKGRFASGRHAQPFESAYEPPDLGDAKTTLRQEELLMKPPAT